MGCCHSKPESKPLIDEVFYPQSSSYRFIGSIGDQWSTGTVVYDSKDERPSK